MLDNSSPYKLWFSGQYSQKVQGPFFFCLLCWIWIRQIILDEYKRDQMYTLLILLYVKAFCEAGWLRPVVMTWNNVSRRCCFDFSFHAVSIIFLPLECKNVEHVAAPIFTEKQIIVWCLSKLGNPFWERITHSFDPLLCSLLSCWYDAVWVSWSFMHLCG